MKIAWHMPTLRHACCGLSNRALRLADGLRRFGHDVTFLVEAGKTDVTTATLNGHCVQRLLSPRKGTLHWSLQALTRRRAASAITLQIPCGHDVMLTCQPEFAAAYATRGRHVPLVFICGGTTLLHDGADAARSKGDSWVRRRLFALDRFLKHRNERTAFRLADAVVFDSDATQLRVTRDYGLKPDRFETIHGGIDRNGFSPPTPQQRQDARRRLGIAHSDVVSTWTGRLSPEKNIDLLLKALACSRRPPNRVLIVGDGPARGELEKLSHELSLGGVVSYMGAQTDVRPFLHAADIFVFPSRGESFGGALVEAMACGLPCIALRPDGEAIRNANLEIIAHEKSGLLVDRAEPAALAAAIERLSADRELRTTLGNSARRATLPFTWSAASARLNMLLNEIVAGDSRRESLLDAPPLAPLQTAHV